MLIFRLVYVAQKYNPVRPFTAEGTVGLGGPLVVSESDSTEPSLTCSLPAGRSRWISTLGTNPFALGCEFYKISLGV
jgi:hypothetical protein